MPEIKELKRHRRELFFLALKGRQQWRRIVKRYGLKKSGKKTAVILLPKDDQENSYFALLYLDRMLSRHDYQSAVILARTDIDQKAAPLLSKKIRAVERVSDEAAEALLQFYTALPFDRRFICASLTDVKCRDGKKLLGTCGITIEEMVAIGVYRIVPFVRKQRVEYSGEDRELASFMSLGGACIPMRTSLKIR